MVLISDNLKQSIRKNVNFYFVTNLVSLTRRARA